MSDPVAIILENFTLIWTPQATALTAVDIPRGRFLGGLVQPSGPGTISGTVAVSDTKSMLRVTLLEHLTLKPVAQTWSDPETGEYEFTGLAIGKKYLVICDDYTQIYNAAVADWVEAEV